MAFFLSSVCNDQQIDANGNPLTGGQVETWLAGSTTPAATYTSVTGLVTQGNPIILNTLGLPASPIWLSGGVSYKFIVKDANGAILRTIDNVSGINDASITVSEWVSSGFVPTFTSSTTFSVPGDQTQILQANRRLRTQNTAGLIYSFITTSVFSAAITTVTVTNDAGALDSGLSTVEYGLLSATNKSIPQRITGTVSQVGGFPTGAIFERGSNANGQYTRFADGTQICTGTVAGTMTAVSNIDLTPTYAAAFSAAPAVTCAPTGLVASTVIVIYRVIPAATNATISGITVAATAVTGTLTVNFMAIGRWF